MSGPRVLIPDPITQIPWSYDVERDLLAARGVELVVPADESAARAALPEADVVLAQGNWRIDADIIGRLVRCVAIVSYGIGTDFIDSDAAAAASIAVRNTVATADEVADHALTLLLAAERRLVWHATRGAAGDWGVYESPEFMTIRRLRGQTLGILGAGRIATRVARRARVFGFRTIAHDPFVGSSPDPDLVLVPLERLLAEADALVLCASLTPSSRGIISRAALARVRPGIVLVNVARGGLLDEDALADALRDGRIAVAALDVRATEPPDRATDPLAGLPNVILTPHMAASSIEGHLDVHTVAAGVCLGALEDAGRLAG